jgi:hypothetical protein
MSGGAMLRRLSPAAVTRVLARRRERQREEQLLCIAEPGAAYIEGTIGDEVAVWPVVAYKPEGTPMVIPGSCLPDLPQRLHTPQELERGGAGERVHLVRLKAHHELRDTAEQLVQQLEARRVMRTR